MKKNKKVWIILSITIFPILIGAMNTIFIKPEDVGSWENYVGYAFLVLGFINLIMTIVDSMSKKVKEHTVDVILKIIAIVIPVYFVYY